MSLKKLLAGNAIRPDIHNFRVSMSLAFLSHIKFCDGHILRLETVKRSVRQIVLRNIRVLKLQDDIELLKSTCPTEHFTIQ